MTKGNANNTSYHISELLAPAGSPEAFYGAIHGGADAVYLAGNKFGARAYAENFTTEKLVECIKYAHLHNRKVYLTVNTLLKENELNELFDYLLPFYEAGLDAVIVQDLGVFRFIREYFPLLELHVSTQMTLCSGYGAKLLKEMGATRVVPARELSLQELVDMKKFAGLEIETFIHGAMCYCYSGQCLFSSILGGRSGNRGRCAQPCRLPYTVTTRNITKENCYPLSLKDMCTIEHIPLLIEAGIDSFKIEGRMKKPEYAAGVTDIYRRAMDSYYNLREKKGVKEATEAFRVPKTDIISLRSLYIRSDIQDGYYFKHNGKEMVTMINPAYSGSDDALLQRIHDKFLTEPLKLPLKISADFKEGFPATVTLTCNNITVTEIGDIVQAAQKQPITEENIRKQLTKLGDSVFYAVRADINLEGNCFYPLKQMNDLRRKAVESLVESLLEANDYHSDVRTTVTKHNPISETAESFPCAGTEKSFAVSVRTLTQLQAVAERIIKDHKAGNRLIQRIYIDGDLILDEWETIQSLIGQLSDNCKIWIALPYILRSADEMYLEQLYSAAQKHKMICGFLVRSMDGLGYLKEKELSEGKSVSCRADAGVYVWNKSALQELKERISGFCLPYELKAANQRKLVDQFPCEKIVYSRIPMMITANCLLKTTDRCNKNSNEAVVLTDRYHKDFKVIRNCRHCTNIIYNSVPLSLLQDCAKWRELADLRIDFTYESVSEVTQILDSFLDGKPFPYKEYTTGHEKRGVE